MSDEYHVYIQYSEQPSLYRTVFKVFTILRLKRYNFLNFPLHVNTINGFLGLSSATHVFLVFAIENQHAAFSEKCKISLRTIV